MSTEDTIKVLGKIKRGEFVTKKEFNEAILRAETALLLQITLRSSW